jgi:hypothetical protein
MSIPWKKMRHPIHWDEDEHPRAISGEFDTKEGRSETDERSLWEKAKVTKRGVLLKKIGSAIWKASNVLPSTAQAVINETGVSEQAAKTAYVVAMIGDYSLPGIPAGSAALIVAATIKSPRAPMKAARKAILEALGKDPREVVPASAQEFSEYQMAEIDKKDVSEIAQIIESKKDKDWFIQLLAVAIEETGDTSKALKAALRAYDMGTPS